MKRSKELLGSVRNPVMILMCVFFCSGLILLCIATDRYLFSEEKQQAAEAAAPPEVIMGFPVQDIKDMFGVSEAQIEDLFCITVTDDMKIEDFDGDIAGFWDQSHNTLTIDYTGSYEDLLKLCDGDLEYFTKDGMIHYSDGSVKPDNTIHMYNESFCYVNKTQYSFTRVYGRIYRSGDGYRVELRL
ncbi:MAG: hypothetical protein IIZ73_05770 [Ruminococcus sp.]|nr:hypothetical protein [Ruminococcus sp.]